MKQAIGKYEEIIDQEDHHETGGGDLPPMTGLSEKPFKSCADRANLVRRIGLDAREERLFNEFMGLNEPILKLVTNKDVNQYTTYFCADTERMVQVGKCGCSSCRRILE